MTNKSKLIILSIILISVFIILPSIDGYFQSKREIVPPRKFQIFFNNDLAKKIAWYNTNIGATYIKFYGRSSEYAFRETTQNEIHLTILHL